MDKSADVGCLSKNNMAKDMYHVPVLNKDSGSEPDTLVSLQASATWSTSS